MIHRPERPRVLCCGPNKTGTASLSNALEQLGYPTLHNPYTFNKAVSRALGEGVPLLTYLRDYDAFTDVLFPHGTFATHERLHYAQIDLLLETWVEQYPRTYFIFNRREIESWIVSRSQHVARNRANRGYNGPWTTLEPEAWREEMALISRKVTSFFKGRTEPFIEIDVCAGDGWEKLCPFLKKEVPEEDFPLRNTAASKRRAGNGQQR